MDSLEYDREKNRALRGAEDHYRRATSSGPLPDAVMAVETAPPEEVDVSLTSARAPRAGAGAAQVSPLANSSPPQSLATYEAEKKKKKPSGKGKVMLARDASGDGVTVLQDFLRGAGYDVGAVDGKFGGKTEDAVKQFQRDNGLTVDGLVGEEVAQKIIGMQQSERDLLRPLSGPGGTYDDKGGYVGSKGEDDFVRYLITDRPTMSASIPIGRHGFQGPAGLERITEEIARGITPDAARYLYQENMISKDAFNRVLSMHGVEEDDDGIAGGTP